MRSANTCLLLVAMASLVAAPAAAQSPGDAQATSGVALATPSLTEQKDATALAVNPANLAFLDSWSFSYAGAWVAADQQAIAGAGHGLFFAFPLGPLALGLSTEFLAAPLRVQNEWQGLADRTRLTLALALGMDRVVGLAIAYRTFFSDSRYFGLDDVDTLDLALSVRPVNQLALSMAVRDVNTAEVTYGPTASHDGAVRVEEVPLRWNVGLTLRPFGNDRFALGGELAYQNRDDFQRSDLGGNLAVMVADGLTVRGRVMVNGVAGNEARSWQGDASLSFDFASFGLTGGLLARLDPDADVTGATWQARLSGAAWPSLHEPPRVPVLDLDGRPSAWGLARLVAKFERLRTDDAVDFVLFRPAAGSLGLTEAEEVRRQIRNLEQAGKQVVCYLEEATTSVYLACAPASHVWVNPAGGVRLAGLSSQLIHLRGLLDKVGVKADLVRLGEYKSAPEMFTETKPSAAAEEQMNAYLDAAYARLLSNVQLDRELPDLEAARRVVESGPFTATEAKNAKLVDELVTADRLEEKLGELVDGPLALDTKYGSRPLEHRRYLDSPAVAVVYLSGDIVDGESINVPLLGYEASGAESVTKILRDVADDPRIGAVVLRIESPGGSALASDILWNEVMRLKERKPVVASLGAVAASGGYYIAAAASEIFAEPQTITGSIGIFYGKADISGLLGKVGVDVTTLSRGPQADMESWTRPYTQEERQKLGAQLKQYYELFLDRVAAGRGRGFTRELVDKVGRGRVWSGTDARRHLLVDDIGGLARAIARARELGEIPTDVKIYEYPDPPGSIVEMLADALIGNDVHATEQVIGQVLSASGLRAAAGAALPLVLAGPERPLARLPYAVIER